MNTKSFLSLWDEQRRRNETEKALCQCLPFSLMALTGQSREIEKANFTDNICKVYIVILNIGNNFSWQINLIHPGYFHQDITISCRDSWQSWQKQSGLIQGYGKEWEYEATGTEMSHCTVRYHVVWSDSCTQCNQFISRHLTYHNRHGAFSK